MSFWETVAISAGVVIILSGGGILAHNHYLKRKGMLPKGDAGGATQVGASVGGSITTQTQSAATPMETAAALITTQGAAKLQKV